MRRSAAAILFFLLLTGAAADSPRSAELVQYALSDARVLYVYGSPQHIDWPTLYYLNDHWGARIDLACMHPRIGFHLTTHGLPDKQIFLHNAYLSPGNPGHVDSLISRLFADRRSDLIVFASDATDSLSASLWQRLLDLPPEKAGLFEPLRFFRQIADDTLVDSAGSVIVLNAHEIRRSYIERMRQEIPLLLPSWTPDDLDDRLRSRYGLVENRVPTQPPPADFLSGIEQLRLLPIIDSLFFSSPMKRTYIRQANRFISGFRAAQHSVGQHQVDNILDGYRELRTLTTPIQAEGGSIKLPAFHDYIVDLAARAERAALDAVGIAWDGRISLRDSPHGPKVKFRLTVSVNGPREVTLTEVRFHPHWDTTEVVLDKGGQEVTPHQSFVREFLIDVDRERLQSDQPDSLTFTAGLTYGAIPLEFTRSAALRQSPRLTVRFDPDFHFVPPPADLDIDRLVSPTALNVFITKPRDYTASATIDLQTPRGVFAGAYRQELELAPGQTREIVRIPFTISNLMELGRQQAVVNLQVDGRTLAADTVAMRLARCRVSDEIAIGFLPDSTGRLEDVLRMTEVNFRPLTDRSLLTADLRAYNVIVIGPGASRRYPSLKLIRDRLEEYIRWGGSLVVLGQDYDWPEGVLPFSLVPSREMIGRDDIALLIDEARVLSRPYSVSVYEMRNAFHPPLPSAGAAVSPAEVVLQTPTGSSLLSVSRLGTGQMIYCGLPLLQLVAELDIEAIHLLANILNY